MRYRREQGAAHLLRLGPQGRGAHFESQLSALEGDRGLPPIGVEKPALISFPKRARYFLQRDPRRFRAVLRISMRAIERTIARHCPQAPRGARVAAVLFCQNFGASLNVHHHGHFVVSDGVYALDDEGNLTLTDRELVLDDAAIDKLTETIRTRVLRHLVRHGCLETDDADNMLSWEHHGGFSLDASV